MPRAGRGFFVAAATRGCVCQRRNTLFDKRIPRVPVAARRSSRSTRRGIHATPFARAGPSAPADHRSKRGPGEALFHESPARAGRRLRVIVTKDRRGSTSPRSPGPLLRSRPAPIPASDPTGGRGSFSIRLPLGTISRIEGHSSVLPASIEIQFTFDVGWRRRTRPGDAGRTDKVIAETVGPCHRRSFIRAPRSFPRAPQGAPSHHSP